MGIRLSVIIPVHNKWELTRQCLASLASRTDGDDYEVLVVDNASSDATAGVCDPTGRALFGDRFRHLRLERNRNFAGACNAGAEAALGDLLLFLNNDTILAPGWRAPLVAGLAGNPRLGAVGPLLLYPESDGFRNRVQHLGVSFGPTLQVSHLYEFFPDKHPLVAKQRRFQAITAAALLLSARLFARLGRFDEGFVNGFEDLDLCARIHGAGLEMACAPESRIYHLCGQTPGRGAHDAANSRLLTAKCSGVFTPDRQALLEADGYALRLTAWLTYEVEIEARLAASLRARMKKEPEPAAVLALLQEEPYWIEGYEALAGTLERQDRPEEALRIRLLATRFRSTPETLLPLWQAARRLDLLGRFPDLAQKLGAHATLSRADRIRAMRRLRAFHKAASPSLAADAAAFLGREDAFYRSSVLPLQAIFGASDSRTL